MCKCIATFFFSILTIDLVCILCPRELVKDVVIYLWFVFLNFLRCSEAYELAKGSMFGNFLCGDGCWHC